MSINFPSAVYLVNETPLNTLPALKLKVVLLSIWFFTISSGVWSSNTVPLTSDSPRIFPTLCAITLVKLQDLEFTKEHHCQKLIQREYIQKEILGLH